jgi:hypothetical protein
MVTPAHAHGGGVFHLDVARQRGHVGLHAFHRTDQPVDQVDVVAGLVHERATVELPGATPLGAVEVILRALPEHVDVHHVDAPEALLLHGLLQQRQRGIVAVLLDDEESHALLVAAAHHLETIGPPRGHGLLGHHVATGFGHLDGLGRMQAAGSAQRHHVAVGLREHRGEVVEPLRPGGFDRLREAPGIRIADGHHLGIRRVDLQRLEVIAGDAAAAHHAETDLPACDRRCHLTSVLD